MTVHAEGRYALQYVGPIPGGWWTGCKGIDLDDVEAYIAGVRKTGRMARAIDNVTGEVFGEPVAVLLPQFDECPLCGDRPASSHPADGRCLL